MAGAGWDPGWVPAQGEISVSMSGSEIPFTVLELCTISVTSNLPSLPLVAEIPAFPGAPRGAGAQGVRRLSLRWDNG